MDTNKTKSLTMDDLGCLETKWSRDWKPDTDHSTGGECEICGRPGLWICGAGQILCANHQDDY